LKLENLEQNYQSATFSIHGLGFWRGRRVDLETTSQVQQDVTREQRIVYVNQDCIKGEFDAVEVHRKLVYTLDTTVYGFDSPSYAWFVDGIPIPNAPNSLVKFDTEVTVPFPPHGNASGGAISKTELVEVWCTVNSNRLTISAGPLPVTGLISATKPGVISGPGNFQCNVEVQVRENAAPKVLPVISQDMALSFPCELLEMGVDSRHPSQIDRELRLLLFQWVPRSLPRTPALKSSYRLNDRIRIRSSPSRPSGKSAA